MIEVARVEDEPEDELQTEEVLRAGMYRLLAALLSTPPDMDVLKDLAGLTGDPTPLGKAIAALAAKARTADPAALAQEYQDLFIGLGRGEVIPFGSYYLTGFLQEKPLDRKSTRLNSSH